MDGQAEEIMRERFGKDTVIALATAESGRPYVRYVNAYYDNGAFYLITHALSNKVRHMQSGAPVALAGEWMTAHGIGVSLGSFGKRENQWISERLRQVFAAWINNGHNNLYDENCIIVRIELTDGVLLSHGTRYEF